MRRRGRGFTLIELLIAAVVLAVLAAIAVPSYRSHVLRTQRTDATAALLRVQAAQEKFFLQHNRYADRLSDAPPAGLGLPAVSEQGHYELHVSVGANADSFSASAVPRAGTGQADDARCRRFTIDHNGLRAAFDAAGVERTPECWR